MNSNFQLVLDPTTGKATFKGKLPASNVEGAITAADIAALNGSIALINQRLEELEMAVTNVTNGVGLFPWITVADGAETAAINTGYFVNSPTNQLTTITLPAVSPVGSVIKVMGRGQGQWRIAQLANQEITFGDKRTVMGAAGAITSTHIRDSILLICVGEDTLWQVESAIGNPFVVEE